MDIKDVFRLESGTIVQNVGTKDRYVVYNFSNDKYLIRYSHRKKCEFLTSSSPWQDVSKIICIPTNSMILAEYQILPDFKKQENFIYVDDDGTYNRGIILSVENLYYDAVIAKKDKLEHFIICQEDMWRMRKIE